jgi:hypothetical protein
MTVGAVASQGVDRRTSREWSSTQSKLNSVIDASIETCTTLCMFYSLAFKFIKFVIVHLALHIFT